MTDDDVLQAFSDIRSYRVGGERAPHKPLLLLLALAALQRGERWLAFAAVEPALSRLLIDFGRPGPAVRPEYPFWRLQNDGIWIVAEEAELRLLENASGDVPAVALRAVDANGGFPRELFEHLRARPGLVNAVAAGLLEQTFPDSLHEPVLDASGVVWTVTTRRRRDPKFREEILRIYERRCAICGHDLRMGATELGLDAAHIRWHSADGPDTAENGLALCSLHHVALDRGALTIDDDRQIQVSQHVTGPRWAARLILRHAGRPLRLPQPGTPPPAEHHLRWHRREVFRGPERQPV